MVSPAEQVLNMPFGCYEKKAKWALLDCMMEAFPSPECFVAAAKQARLPFVKHMWDVESTNYDEQLVPDFFGDSDPPWDPFYWSVR